MTTTPFRLLLPLLALGALLLAPASARAHDDALVPGKLVLVDGKTDAAWLDNARAAYPIDTCVVSGEKLSDHGDSKRTDAIYREAGKPDRLVRFCCKGCTDDFEKNPAKFLKLIDEAAAKKAHP